MNKEKSIKTLGIDLGNGYIKACENKKQLVEPTVFCYLEKQDFELTKYRNIFKYNEKNILIGYDAMNSAFRIRRILGNEGSQRYSEDIYKKMILSVIYKMYKSKVLNISNLVLGLPNNHYHKSVDIIKGLFKPNHFEQVLVDGKCCRVKVGKVTVIPQPIGTYFSTLFENQVNQKNDNVIIIDVGQGTLDVTQINKGNISKEFANDRGINMFYNSMKNILNKRYEGMNYTLPEVENIFNEGYFKYAGKEIKIQELEYTNTLELYFEEILEDIRSEFSSFNQFDKVVFTGGGSQFLHNNINKLELENIIILNQMSNAKGFYLYGENKNNNS